MNIETLISELKRLYAEEAKIAKQIASIQEERRIIMEAYSQEFINKLKPIQ